jgi:hypothetical protein
VVRRISAMNIETRMERWFALFSAFSSNNQCHSCHLS